MNDNTKPVSKDPVRLNKYLSDAGVCSRRQADRYVEAGRITVDGQPAVMGQKILPSQTICLDGKPVSVSRRRIILAVNKPQGIVCTTEKREKDNIVDFIGYSERIYPMGRLDKDSEGLILMTNDGELMDQILRARNYHEKEYLVRVNRPVTMDFLKKMRSGVPILDTVTRPCKVEKVGPYMFKIVLTQGLNRQIRRMCEALDYRVRWLKRVRIMNINLDGLPVGQYREIKGEELRKLELMLKQDPKKSAGENRNKDE
ncbi:MAG: pseudouridine synthase [Eubacterium sp.]|nr:pseudouridine synthase [Eubacterium sp.]